VRRLLEESDGNGEASGRLWVSCRGVFFFPRFFEKTGFCFLFVGRKEIIGNEVVEVWDGGLGWWLAVE